MPLFKVKWEATGIEWESAADGKSGVESIVAKVRRCLRTKDSWDSQLLDGGSKVQATVVKEPNDVPAL